MSMTTHMTHRCENRVVFDLTDLIVHYGNSATPTGIQRVVERLLGSKVVQQTADVFFVFRSKNSEAFWSFTKTLLHELRHSETRPNAISRLQTLDQYRRDRLRLEKTQTRPWKFLKRKYRDMSRRMHQTEIVESLLSFQLQTGDILVIPGAFWIEDDISQLCAELRQRHRLQIVLVVYDLIPINHGWCVSYTEKFEREFRTLILSCDRIVAISKHVAREAAEYLIGAGGRRKPIFILSFGWEFLDEPSDITESDTLRKYALSSRKFIMIVGTIEHRKNQLLVARAAYNLYPRLKDKIPPIIFVGKRGAGAEFMEEEVASMGFLGKRIRILSDITDADLANLYAACLFTIFPSFAEGWGLPVQESLAFGRPCLASRTTSIPEAGLDLATYFDPFDLSAFQELLASWLENPCRVSEAEDRIARHMAAHKPLTWEQSAAAFLCNIRTDRNPAQDQWFGCTVSSAESCTG